MAGVKLSKQQKAQTYVIEYMKCRRDFEYFSRNYVYLELPGGDVLFNPYKKQLELTNKIFNEHFVITLKSRQIGISTVIKAYSAWLTVFYDNVVIGIISKDGKEATDFARDIRGMIEKLPDWMKPTGGVMGRGFDKRTEQSFILTNGSKVYASPVAPHQPEKTLRGKAITFLVIDEAAFVNYIDTAWTSLVPTLSTNQKQARAAGIPYGTVILSTPNKTVGVGKFFFRRYSNALSRDDIFRPFTIHWKMIPELANDPSWYKTQCQLFDNDPRKIAQELELKFLPTEGSYFDADTMEKVQNAVQPPKEILKLFNGEAWVWERAEARRMYLIGVDTAPEQGFDKSAITVWDYETLNQVWEYQGKLKVMDYVKLVKIACSQYPGVCVIENNSYGNQVIEEMDISEVAHMLYREKRGENKIVCGLNTNSRTRPLMLEALYSYVTEFPYCVRSERLALELSGLISKANGRIEAEQDCRDDLAFATALAFYVRKYDSSRVILDTPLLQHSTALISDLVNMNLGNQPALLTGQHPSNAAIMKQVKEKLTDFTNESPVIDILDFYERT